MQSTMSDADRLPTMLGLPPGDVPAGRTDRLVGICRRAEDAGFAGVVLSEHVVMGNRTEGVAALTKALTEAGRDPTRLRVQAHLPVARGSDGQPDLAASLAGLPELAANEATAAVTPIGAFVRHEDELVAWLESAGRGLWAEAGGR
jgi:dihydrodipicolinate synthase/N-acetylneuraminate lyase